MEKLDFKTRNTIKSSIEKLAQIFPTAIVETKDKNGNLIKKINLNYLRELLTDEIVETNEVYEFTWPGKNQAILESNRSITKVLRPEKDKSKDWNNTKNIFIEGDNLDGLKLIQESYLERVKIIYIDPPYNTGSDFIYQDNFKIDDDDYNKKIGLYNDEQERLFKNTDTNGRFHSDWCSMIYARLMIARNLLCDSGVIFISIDDHEQENLKKICNEIFGERNFIAQIIWERAFSPVNLKKHFSASHDFILCYAKNIDAVVCKGLKRNAENDARYTNPDNDRRGVWTSGDLSVGPVVQEKIYEIETPSGRKVLPPNGYCWRLDRETFEKYKLDNRIWFGETGDNVPRIKRFLSEVKQGITPMTIWKYTDVGSSQDATKELKKLFNGKSFFDYPKPVKLIKRCIDLYSEKDSIIIDFFSGSATTAQAVLELNAEDGGNRKFIMIQLPEQCDVKTEAYKHGFYNICQIGQERIKRAGKKIFDETKAKIDYGFRVFKVDTSNMRDVYYSPEDYKQDTLPLLESNIKSDRSEIDLLFGCVLDLGLRLSLAYFCEDIEGCNIHTYGNKELIACFAENVPETVIKVIANRKPRRVVFRDTCFKDSPSKLNVTEIFKVISPNTVIKVM